MRWHFWRTVESTGSEVALLPELREKDGERG